MTNVDHIVADASVYGCIVMRCLHCAASVTVRLPVSVDELCNIEPAFREKHERCEPLQVKP